MPTRIFYISEKFYLYRVFVYMDKVASYSPSVQNKTKMAMRLHGSLQTKNRNLTFVFLFSVAARRRRRQLSEESLLLSEISREE